MSRVSPALLTRMCRSPERLHDPAGQRLGLLRIAKIGRDGMGPLAQLPGQGIERLAPRAGKGDRRAPCMQGFRDGPADGARGAGHKRVPAGKVEHGIVPNVVIFRRAAGRSGRGEEFVDIVRRTHRRFP